MHIFYRFPTLEWRSSLKPFLIEDKDRFIIFSAMVGVKLGARMWAAMVLT